VNSVISKSGLESFPICAICNKPGLSSVWKIELGDGEVLYPCTDCANRARFLDRDYIADIKTYTIKFIGKVIK